MDSKLNLTLHGTNYQGTVFKARRKTTEMVDGSNRTTTTKAGDNRTATKNKEIMMVGDNRAATTQDLGMETNKVTTDGITIATRTTTVGDHPNDC